jgi:uncharacterized membrane protein YtjA (UPF0391 family)
VSPMRSAALVAGVIGLIALIVGFAADSNAAGAVGSALVVIAAVVFVADLILGRRREPPSGAL